MMLAQDAVAASIIGYVEGLLLMKKIDEPFATTLRGLIDQYDRKRVVEASSHAYTLARRAGLEPEAAMNEAEAMARRLCGAAA